MDNLFDSGGNVSPPHGTCCQQGSETVFKDENFKDPILSAWRLWDWLYEIYTYLPIHSNHASVQNGSISNMVVAPFKFPGTLFPLNDDVLGES